MAKPLLEPQLQALESEMIHTMIAGLNRDRPDLRYPESWSDMQSSVRALLQRFIITARHLPLGLQEMIATDAAESSTTSPGD